MRKFLTYGLLTITLLFGCDQDSLEPAGESIDFYLLSDYTTEDNSFKIIDGSAKLSDTKIISYSDIISYSRKTSTFTVGEGISEKLLHGSPFALTVDDEVIYTGYFWAAYSSTSVDWITIDPMDYSGKNELRVNLGYPGLVEGDIIPDKRNDAKIINTLKLDNKLVD